MNARILGVVLNEVNPRSRKYDYYYNRYYSKYAYYYGEDGKKQDTWPSKMRKITQVTQQMPEADPTRMTR